MLLMGIRVVGTKPFLKISSPFHCSPFYPTSSFRALRARSKWTLIYLYKYRVHFSFGVISKLFGIKYAICAKRENETICLSATCKKEVGGKGTCIFEVKIANNFLTDNSCMINFSDTPLRNGFSAACMYRQEHLNIFVGLLKQVFVGFSSVYRTMSLWREALYAAIWIGTA